MSMQQTLAADALAVFLGSGDFAESVIYTPAGGTPRPINAQVYRNGAEGALKGQRVARSAMVIEVADDPVNGISSASMTAQDTVTVALRKDETATPHSLLLPPLNADSAMMKIALA